MWGRGWVCDGRFLANNMCTGRKGPMLCLWFCYVIWTFHGLYMLLAFHESIHFMLQLRIFLLICLFYFSNANWSSKVIENCVNLLLVLQKNLYSLYFMVQEWTSANICTLLHLFVIHVKTIGWWIVIKKTIQNTNNFCSFISACFDTCIFNLASNTK